jgi:hypothetical protein
MPNKISSIHPNSIRGALVVNELEYVRLRVVPARDLNPVRDFPDTLLETSRVARVYPDNQRLWRPVSNSAGVFDGKLRLSVTQVSGENWPIPFGPDKQRSLSAKPYQPTIQTNGTKPAFWPVTTVQNQGVGTIEMEKLGVAL